MLSPITTAQLIAQVEGRRAEIIAFAQSLIGSASENPPGDERGVATLVCDRLRQLGVHDVRVLGENERRPNILARVAGAAAGSTLILSGHLDTKPAGDRGSWHTDPWDPVVRDGQLYGLGSGDMKGAIAALTYAAAVLRDAGLPRGQVSLVFTADEEAGKGFGAPWLAGNGHLQGDAAIIAEPSGITEPWEAVHIVSRGALTFRTRVRGLQTHSSLSDRFPVRNACLSMARLMLRMDHDLKAALTYLPHPLCPLGPTVNVGVTANGGVFYGVIPGSAEFRSEVRTIPGMTREQTEKDILAYLSALSQAEPALAAEIEVDGWAPATEISAEHPVVEALRAAAQSVLGIRPPVGAFPGGTDATHFQLSAGIPTVAAFGPGFLPRAHGPNECLSVDSIVEAAKIYVLAARRFLE